MKHFGIIVVMLLAGGWRALSQGFINLNFESATIVPIMGSPLYPYAIATTDALPGWTVTTYQQTTPATQITYNDPALGSSAVNLWATNGQQISGNYSVLLQGGVGPGVSINQSGSVPGGTQSLLFEAQPGLGTLLVSLGGQNIPFFAIGTGPNYTLYGGDASMFAGQNDQLIFSAVGGGDNNWNIDNIVFSPSPIPEPSTLALAAAGALLLGLARWRK